MKTTMMTVLSLAVLFVLLSLAESSFVVLLESSRKEPQHLGWTDKAQLLLQASNVPSSNEEDIARKLEECKGDYECRRKIWLDRYGSFEALEKTFGSETSIWGGLTPEETRRLYHTLLPRSLAALYEMGLMNPEELAPLAYEARVAAKQYARSRCVWTGRLLTSLFDQYRSLRDRGRFGAPSMTWDEIWQKYEAQIVEEECADALEGTSVRSESDKDDNLTMRIYLRILEKSCETNQAFDRLFLKEDKGDNDDRENKDQLAAIASQLDYDVRAILLNPKENKKATKQVEKWRKEQKKEERKEEKAKLKEDKKQRKVKRKVKKTRIKAERKEAKKQKRRKKNEHEIVLATLDEAKNNISPNEQRRWEVRRILAATRRKFGQLQNHDST